MESKIFIDINYASRDPQIVIHLKHTDDPRDKLVTMLTGHAMPGVRDGYCRIERSPDQIPSTNVEMVVITPIHPVDMIEHIPAIARFAHENAVCDTSEVPGKYRKIVQAEYDKYIDRKTISVDPPLSKSLDFLVEEFQKLYAENHSSFYEESIKHLQIISNALVSQGK